MTETSDGCPDEGIIGRGRLGSRECHSCMEHHLAECDKLKMPRDKVFESVRVGLMVNRGAERAIRKHSRELLGGIAADLTT